MGAQIRAVRPNSEQFTRDSLAERAVLRHLAPLAAKVSRQTEELERHKPVNLTANPAVPRPNWTPRGTAAVVRIQYPPAPMLRAELLDLPPPSMSL